MPSHTLNVYKEHDQKRLDVFLMENLRDLPSRTFAQKLIDEGRVTLNKKIVKAHHKVSPGDEIIATWEDDDFESDLEPEKIKLDIFFEDDQVLVINKPSGMLVHPATGRNSGTLVNALLYHCKKLSDVNSAARPGIVHRLDKETSGLILVAKDNKTHVKLANQFERRLINKRYVALVEGRVEFDEGLIEVPLGRHPKYHAKKAVQFDDSAKPAKTFYRVIERFKKGTKVALFPHTGRTHQLRVHMSYIGHPILGDDKYGKKFLFPRLALHAQSIGFFHPKTSAYLEFWSTLPPEFNNLE